MSIKIEMDREKKSLQALADAMEVRIRRGGDRWPLIQGRRGNIHVDGDGYSVAILERSPQHLYQALVRLDKAIRVTQRGYSEAVVRLVGVPDKHLCQALRRVIGCFRCRKASPEEVERPRGVLGGTASGLSGRTEFYGGEGTQPCGHLSTCTSVAVEPGRS